MALDFGILQPANISGQLQAGQESAMRNQLAQQQLASGRTEQEMSQMKLSELRRNTAALESMQRKFLENGKSDDMDANYDAMISSGIPHFMDIGIKAKQTLAQTRIDYATMGLPMPSYLQPKGQGAATGAPALNVVSRNEGVPQPVPAASEDRLGDFISQIEAKQNAPMPMPAVTGRPIQPEMAAAPNALAPAAAPAANMLAPPPAAPANALAAPGMSAEEQRARTMLLSQNPGVRAAGQTELNRLMTLHTLAPGSSLRDASGRIIAQALEKPPAPPSMVAEYTFAKTPDGGNFKGSYQDFVTARAAAGRAPRPEAAPRTQQVTMSDGTLGIMNMDTGAVTPSTLGGVPVKGKPSAFAEKTAAQQKQMGRDLSFAITQLGDVTKDGGLIDQSTGSGAGRLVDIGAGFVGQATKGAIAIGKIAPIADLVLKMVPRFEGPQSNKDTQSYKEAAGQLADPTLPTTIRKEAGKTVLRIMTERKNQFVSNDMAAEGAAAGGGVIDFGSLK
jgi:hypothetical protein